MHIFRKAEKCEKCMDVDLSYQCDHVCDVAPRIGDVSDLHCVAAQNGETNNSDLKCDEPTNNPVCVDLPHMPVPTTSDQRSSTVPHYDYCC